MLARFIHQAYSCLLSLSGLVTVTQMATVREIQTHQSLMRSHDSLVDLQVGWRARQALNIDTPFLVVQVESSKSTSLAGQLDRVNVLVSTVISSTRITLGVFVGHWGSQSIEDGAGSDIFGSDKDDGFSLTLDLEFLQTNLAKVKDLNMVIYYHNLCDLWVGVEEGSLKHLLR